MLLAQAHEPEARAVALLGMPLGGEDGGHELAGDRPRRLGPRDEPRWRPLGVRPMGVRHVRRVGRVLGAPTAPAVRGDPPALEKDLDDGGGEADLDALMQELIGDAVVVVVDGDVVVDVDAGVEPVGELVAGRRQRAQQRTVELLEERATRDTELAHGSCVERCEPLPDRGVELGEAEEAAVPEHGEDPPLGHQHIRLDDRLIARPTCAGGHDCRAVVLREVEIGAVDDRLVAAGRGDAAAEVVGHEDRRGAAEELHHAGVGADPRRQILGRARLGVHVTARAQRADEQFDRDQFARRRVDDRRALAREVDEHFLAGAVDLAHRRRQRAHPLVIVPAELAVAVALGMPLQVLEVEQLQRYSRPLQLLMEPGHVGPGPGHAHKRVDLPEEPGFQLGVVPLGGQRPRQIRLLGPAAIIRHRAEADPTGAGDRPVGQVLVVLQSKNFANLPHR